MYWSKVKTILIIVFFFINIFLLLSMLVTVNKSIVISPETLEATVSILQRNNIKIDSSIIPTKIQNMHSLELINALQDTDAVAGKVFSDDFQTRKNGDRVEYIKGTKTLEFVGCKFSYTDTMPSSNIDNYDVETAEKYVQRFLEKLNIDLQYLRLSRAFKEEDGGIILTFYQEYSKKIIFDSEIVASVTPAGIKSIKGYGLVPKKFTLDKYPGRHVTSILIDFISNPTIQKDKVITIKEITHGYYIPSDKNVIGLKETRAVPKWRITTDLGDQFYYDAVNSQ